RLDRKGTGLGNREAPLRVPLPVLLFECFEEHEAGDTVAVGGSVDDLLAFVQLSHDAGHGFIRVLFRKATAPPLEEPEELGSNLLVPVGGGVTVGGERGQKPFERHRRETPPAARRRIAHRRGEMLPRFPPASYVNDGIGGLMRNRI